ncbi:MAG TPA: helix-turn-helix transcriptional regulator [Azospirillaceae bacterium]|nr:helix-turn-helix transcriptional regulator [Azospirillaceae bacterium]
MTGFGGKKLIIDGEEYLLVPTALCAAMPALPSAAALPPAVLAELAAGKRSPIAVLRNNASLYQWELAESLGLTRVAISQFEAGGGASVETLIGMAAVLEAPVDLLIRRKTG